MATKKIGRIFTSNPKFARKGLKTFTSVSEVEAEFGLNSEEAKFATEYYNALRDNDIKAQELGFESWGYYGTTGAWRRFDGTMTEDGISVTDESGAVTTYESTSAALSALGSHVIVSLTLNKDVAYISPTTKARTAQYNDLVDVLGAESVVETSSDDHLYGFDIKEGQVVILDLNGHKYGGDMHCFVNKGLCYVRDSVGTGCLFTTNFDPILWYVEEDDTIEYDPEVYLVKTDETTGVKKIGWPHSSKWEKQTMSGGLGYYYRETCECIRNEGVCIIEGGWIGTYKPTFDAVINNTTWGNAIGNYGKGMLTINGGQFTTVSFSQYVKDFAGQLGLTTWMSDYDWKSEAVSSGITAKYAHKSWQPYTAVIDAYEESQIIVNGGTFFGMYNDTFEISGELTTKDKHGVLIINDGTFINGFKDWVYTPTNWYGSQSMLQASAPTNGTYPEFLNHENDGWMPAVVFGGTFIDNISTHNKNGGRGRLYMEGDVQYGALRFTGMVSIRGGTFNFTFSDEFKNLEVEYTVREQVAQIETSETPSESVSRSIASTDRNFKPFMFLDAISQEDAKRIANIVKENKYAYLFVDVAESDDDFELAKKNLDGCSGVAVVRKADGAFAELCKVTAPSPFVMEEAFTDAENVFG